MRKSVWLLSAGLFALSAPAYAQQTDTDGTAAQPTDGATAEAGAVSQTGTQATVQTSAPVVTDNGDVSEIVVTATRRNEALSDVPLAVSAVTAEQLQNSGASDIRQLTQISPSLLVSSTSSEAGAGVARIRGVGTVGDNPGLESSVAVFIDGVYRSRTGVGLTELGAIDRVEVLRGPQGTLFGRNASAGLISIITAKPKFITELTGEATVGNYNLRRFEVGLTGPISSTLAARIDGVYLKRDGFLEDVISGRDVNDRKRYLLRGQLLYQPSDDLSVRFIADYAKRNEECCAAPYLPASDSLSVGGDITSLPSSIAAIERGLGAVINDHPYDRDVSITPGRSYRSDVKDYGASVEAVYDFGGAELTSITAYRSNYYIRGQDADFNNLDILYRDDNGGASNRFRTFTQELRLQGSTFGGKLDWLVGGYFANEKLRVKDNLSPGADYSRYANCLVAQNFAALTGQAALVQTSNPTCFNPAVAGALLPFVGANATALAAFARLGAFAAPVFTNSGFTNLSIASGFGPRSFAGVTSQDEFNQSSRNFALFTHNIFEIAEGLKLTVGARYTHERKHLNATLTDNNTLCSFYAAAIPALQQIPCVLPSVPGGSFSDSSNKTEHKVSGTVVLSYKPTPQLLTYASYSRGYKAGGFNLDRAALPRSGATNNGAILTSASLDSLQFDPEINDAIELGAKYNGRGIDVNVALFRELFDDFQLNTFNGIAFQVENINSCSNSLGGADSDNSSATGACDGKVKAGVRSQGVEVEFFTRPLRDVTLNFGGVYAKTRYKHNLVGADGGPISNQLFQLPGRQLSNSAQFTATASFAWTPPIGNSGLRGLFYIDGRHMSTFNTGSDLDIEKTQRHFNVVNARLGLTGPDRMWGIEVWAQNLFKKNYEQVAFDAPLQGSCTIRGAQNGFCSPVPTRATQLFGTFLGEPRTYGLTLRGRFSPPPPAAAPYVAPPAPPPPPPAMQTCPDGSMIEATAVCPPVQAPPPPPPAPERG